MCCRRDRVSYGIAPRLDRDACSRAFLVRFRATDRQDQSFPGCALDVAHIERGEFRASQGTHEAEQDQSAVPSAGERVRRGRNQRVDVVRQQWLLLGRRYTIGATDTTHDVRTTISSAGEASPAARCAWTIAASLRWIVDTHSSLAKSASHSEILLGAAGSLSRPRGWHHAEKPRQSAPCARRVLGAAASAMYRRAWLESS
jgi:hypothetical protein